MNRKTMMMATLYQLSLSCRGFVPSPLRLRSSWTQNVQTNSLHGGIRRKPIQLQRIQLPEMVGYRLFSGDVCTPFEWTYQIVRIYMPVRVDEAELNLKRAPKTLFNLDRDSYRTVSQAAKSCRLGEIVIFRHRCNGNAVDDTDMQETIDGHLFLNVCDFPELSNRDIIIASSDTIITDGDIIAIRQRSPDEFYPPHSGSGYVHPPTNLAENFSIDVVYEDDHISLVNKPELLTTIGKKRDDLQSMLPFILAPPRQKLWRSSNFMIPRPVHRLDRRTSGLVLVAKTEAVLSNLSRQFAARRVLKSYAAIVFGTPKEEEEGGWHKIDYPIDGKPSITWWKSICTVDTRDYGTVTMLLCRPKSGRKHQIRRHLAYCLECAIVGDSKYDGGGEKERAARSLGMFLCSNAIEFEYPVARNAITSGPHACDAELVTTFDEKVGQDLLADGTSNCAEAWLEKSSENATLRATIPLPGRFRKIMLMAH